MTAQAPDYAEPLQGWRVWRVKGEGDELRLQSVVQKVVWHPCRPLAARCLRQRPLIPRLGRRAPHAAPAEHCECGIYAADLHQLLPYLRPDPWLRGVALVFGQVALWGTVIECERGWRASHAYPSSIYVPASGIRRGLSPEELALALADYQVPIYVLAASPTEAPSLVAGGDWSGGPGTTATL